MPAQWFLISRFFLKNPRYEVPISDTDWIRTSLSCIRTNETFRVISDNKYYIDRRGNLDFVYISHDQNLIRYYERIL